MNTLSRRSFLTFAGGAVVAAVGSSTALARPAVAASARKAGAPMLGATAAPALLRSTFVGALGSTVRMSNGSWSADVVIDSVDDLKGARTPGEQTRFGLMLRAATAAPADSAVYRLSSRRIGTFDLFAAPVDRGRIARYYQVVINPAP